MKRQFKFYPTLLDEFNKYREVSADTFLYQDEQGKWHINYTEADGYHYTQEECEAIAKQRLIDKINRVPQPPSEAAEKGTCFNELVDCLIHKKQSGIMEVTKLYSADDGQKVTALHCKKSGFEFVFDVDLIKQTAEYFKGSLSQVFTQADVPTAYGTVRLYGYIDELRQSKVFDIKTTKQYTFGQYKDYMQRFVYPYCLMECGQLDVVSSFEFTVYVLKSTKTQPVITAEQYKEEYTYDHIQASQFIQRECENFVEFLLDNENLITDRRIFNE